RREVDRLVLRAFSDARRRVHGAVSRTSIDKLEVEAGPVRRLIADHVAGTSAHGKAGKVVDRAAQAVGDGVRGALDDLVVHNPSLVVVDVPDAEEYFAPGLAAQADAGVPRAPAARV